MTEIWKSPVFNEDKSSAAPPGNKRDCGCGGGHNGKYEGRDSPSKKTRTTDPRCVIVFDNKLLKMPNVDNYPNGEKPLSKGCKNCDCKCNHFGPRKWRKALMVFMKEWMAAGRRLRHYEMKP